MTLGKRDEAILVPGEVRAYRLWHVQQAGTVVLLRSSAQPYTLEPGRHIRQAVCLVTGDHSAEDAPAEDCKCGFYGAYANGITALLEAVNVPMQRAATTSTLVFGSVAMSGKVIFGETGILRAQRMRIEGFLHLTAKWDHHGAAWAATIDRLYGGPMFFDPVAFLGHFPLNDVRHLLQGRAPAVAYSAAQEAGLLYMCQEKAHDENADLARCGCPACHQRELKQVGDCLASGPWDLEILATLPVKGRDPLDWSTFLSRWHS